MGRINEDDGYTLRLATAEDAGDINRIMQAGYDSLENKDLFVMEPPEWVDMVLSDPANGFGVMGIDPNGKAVGYFIVYYPGPEDDYNYGFDLGFTYEQRCQVANMETTAVLPEARGHHLEARMVAFAENHIDDKHIYYMGTVSPDNPASYKAAEANGYKCMATKEKYGGKMRRIYLKQIER